MRGPVALLLALSILAIGSTAAAQTSGDVTVQSFELRGVTSISESRLKDVLATRDSAWLPWGRKRFYDERILTQDLERIRAYYRDHGFPDARVSPPEVTFNDQKTEARIVISIEEGDPTTVAAIELNGFEVLPDDHLRQLKDDLPLEIGKPRDRTLVLTSHDLALSELRDHGYPYARVATGEHPGTEPGTVVVVFTAEPGILAHFGEVKITGRTSVGQNVVRRELDYKPGDLYRRSVLQNTQRRLYGLALFQFVNITQVDPDEQSPDVRTQITLTEGKHQRLNGGIGYGSEERFRVDAEYRHLNFFGAARSAGVHGRWSSLDRGVQADVTQPYFFGPHLSLNVAAQKWLTFTEAYESEITGGRIAVAHREGPRTSWSVGLTVERTVSMIADQYVDDPELFYDLIAIGLDPTTGKQEGTLTALGFEVEHNTSDNILDPHRGYHVIFRAEEAGVGLPGTFTYYALGAEGRHYQPLSDDLVFATRFQVGNIGPIGSTATNVPFSKKYFLGGPNTLRGWSRYEVSPLSSSGLPIGGNSFLALSAEIRARVKKDFGVVLFLDAGNVWETSTGFALRDLYYAIGPGFRYNTPVGPIRLDLGYQLNQIQGLTTDTGPVTQRFRFQFSIGQAF